MSRKLQAVADECDDYAADVKAHSAALSAATGCERVLRLRITVYEASGGDQSRQPYGFAAARTRCEGLSPLLYAPPGVLSSSLRRTVVTVKAVEANPWCETSEARSIEIVV